MSAVAVVRYFKYLENSHNRNQIKVPLSGLIKIDLNPWSLEMEILGSLGCWVCGLYPGIVLVLPSHSSIVGGSQ